MAGFKSIWSSLRSNWCPHLIAAGRLLEPPIIVNIKNPKATSLTKLHNNQKFSRLKSGRKRSRPYDFIDCEFNQNETDQEPHCQTEDGGLSNEAQVFNIFTDFIFVHYVW